MRAYSVNIRPDRSTEVEAIARLAQLDSAPVPSPPLLVAEIGGELRAAMSLADGAVVADPFHPTRELVELLELRAEQERPRGGLRERLALWERLWARARPGEVV